jgi:DNA-binding Xre family transcriptional regulator
MAKHIHRKLTPAELERSKKVRAAIEQELPELMAKGQAIFERHERLQRTLAALKAERERQGVSLAEMERRTGITKSALSRLENDPNPNPTVATLDRIANALQKAIVIDLVAA